MINTQTVISNVQYGVPSGNYDGSSQDFLSDPVQAAGYYRGYGSIQTVNITVTDFVGLIVVSASLNDKVDAAAYFTVDTFGDGSSVNTGTFPITVIGNFVWMRVEVIGFHQGAINSITVTY